MIQKRIGGLEIDAGKTDARKAFLFGAEYVTWKKEFRFGIVLVWVYVTVTIR